MARRYAPALTRQAFKQVRPKGRYQNYLNYLTRKRPGWDPARPQVAQRAGPPLRGRLPSYESLLRGLSFESPAQLEARANRMLNQQMKAQRGLVTEEYKAAQDDALKRMQAFQAAGRAAAAMNAELLGRVGGSYAGAGSELGSMGGALAAAMGGATASDVAAANASLGAVGAGPIDPSAIGGATQVGVEQYRGATLPQQRFATEGGAAEFGIAGLIGAQNLRATQEAQAAYMAAMREQQEGRSRAMREMALGRPAAAAEILSQLQDAQRQQTALAMSLLEGRRGTVQERFGRGVERQEQKREKTKLELEQDKFQKSLEAADREARRQGREINEARSIALGYWVDMTGNWVKKNGQRIEVPKTVTTAKTKGSQSQSQNVREDVLYRAQQLVKQYQDRRGNIAISREQLASALIATFPGVKRQVITQIVNALVPATTGKGKGKGKGNFSFAG